MSLSASILLSLLASETDAGDISREVRTTAVEYGLPLTDGTGSNQANLVWSTSGEIDPYADLFLGDAGFVLTDDRGIVTFTSIKVVYLKNTGTGNFRWLAGDWPNGPQGDAGGLFITPGGAAIVIAPGSTGWPTAGSYFGLTNPTAAIQGFDAVLIGTGQIT